MYPQNRPIQPQFWPVPNPATWRQPDYFLNKLFPAHTVMGKLVRAPLINPVGSLLQQKVDKSTISAQDEVIKQYDNALSQNEAAIAEAAKIQQQTVAQVSQEDRNKNMLLILGVAVVLIIGLVLIFKKKT